MVLCCTCRCSVFKFLIPLYMLWFLLFISEAANYLYHICPNTTAFSPNSIYQANLNTLLSTLSSNNTRNDMFYNTTAGNSASDRAYGLFMCRGDVSINTCHDCVRAATSVQRCPNDKEAYIWYDECMLRYGGDSFFSTMDVEPGVYLVNTGNETQRDRLAQVLNNAMSDLATRASGNQSANDGQSKGFATGEANFTNFQTLYNLIQCTPDLSGADCNRCFRVAISRLPSCCSGRPGGRVLLPSCNIRYEMYQFYESTAAPPSPTRAIPPLLPPGSSSSLGGNGSISTQVIIAIVVAVVLASLLFGLGFFFLLRRAKKYGAIQQPIGPISGIDEDEISTIESLQYDLSMIRAVTNNFSAENKVGEGGFGDVFKGTLPNGEEIAVKRLSKSSGQGTEQFKNEVLLVSKLQHRNLVRLVGFCLEREEKILIYEYVPNKSLDNFLFDPEKQQLLDWSTRYKIIRGVTLGILYLHEDSRVRIIHRDLKASNVLVDGVMNPKISDFGMARIFDIDQSQENTNRVVGTFGYMSPEYAMHGQFSVKSDVFSFGVLLLEIISGKKNNTFYQLGGSKDLLSHAWKLWSDGTPLDLVDPILGELFDRNEVIRCIHIGLLCVQEDPEERPTMASVALMLNSYTVTLALPHRPAFFVRSRKEIAGKLLESDESSSKATPWSANGASITELYPR